MNLNRVYRATQDTGMAKGSRRHELDLLRGLVVLALIPYHTATYFIAGDWAPLHTTPGPAVQAILSLGTLIAMPLMFLMAGMGAWYSLRKRGAGAFVGERFRRLFVPLVVGHLILLPPIQYLAFRRSPLFEETFVQFFPSLLDVTLQPTFPPGLAGPRYQIHHLWFLKDLLVYALVLLPVFVWLRTGAGRRVVGGLAAWCTRRWTLFALALPVAAIEAVLGAAGAWNRFTYLLVILYGYFLASDPRFGRALRRQWRIALPVGLALFVAVGVPGIYLFSQAGVDFQTDPGLPSVLFRILKGIVVWLLLVGILGFGGRMRPSDAGEGAAPKVGSGRPPDGTQEVRAGVERVGQGLPERAAEFFRQGVLPIYLLHLPIVIVIGFFVVQWTPVLWLRFAIITLVSLVDTLVVYDLVRRTRVTRFLFGIKPRRSEPGGERTRSKGIPAQLGRLAVAASITLLVVLGGNSVGRSLIGRWEQTLDSSQPAAGYVAEFREDGTWEVTAEGESVGGTYALQGDEAIEIVYADGTESVSGLLMSADRFALISQDGDRVQVFMRSH